MSDTTPVSSVEHAALYGKLRSALLSRHFALGKYFRTNMFFTDNVLEANLNSEDLSKSDKDTQLTERWRCHQHVGENRLLLGGQLLTCLAIEHALGCRDSLKIIRSALHSLGSLFKLRGNHFDGYIVRWDPEKTFRNTVWIS
jgi:hypothetical protein